MRDKHIQFLVTNLSELPKSFVSLDASRPWIIYWITHSLYLLDAEPVHLYERIISTLASMQGQGEIGGFGGNAGGIMMLK